MTTPTILIDVEEPAGIARTNWPAERGIPFLQGELTNPDCVSLKDAQGHLLPIQVEPLLFWPDGSIKWILVHFQATLPAQTTIQYSLEINDHCKRILPEQPVSLTAKGSSYRFDTGPLQVDVSIERGFSILNHVTLNGESVLSGGDGEGFVLVDHAGRRYSSLQGKINQVTIEEAGPLRAVLYLAGDHRDCRGEKLFQYEARLTAHAGLPWVELEYTFINDCDEDYSNLQQISFELTPELSGPATGLVGAYKLLHESKEAFSIYQDKPCQYFFFAGTRIYDHQGNHLEFEHAGEMLKKAAHGWMDLSDEMHGLTVAVQHLAMMAPKAIINTGHSIEVQLWPARFGELRFHQGMARTHRTMLFFHEGTGCQAEVNKMATCYELNLAPWVRDWYVKSQIFGPLFPYEPQKYPEINIRLREQFNAYFQGNMGLGFFDYGDSIQGHTGPRANYTANNEYDLPLVMALQFARTGEREYFDVLEAAAWHMMDIDFIHHTTHAPLELGGVRIHGNEHVQYNCEGMPDYSVATSHMWTEGLIAYYCLTGCKTALDKARRIGQCLVNLVGDGWALPPYKVEWHSVRDSAWPIIALAALYEATYEPQWLECAHKIAEAVVDLQHTDGGWDLYIGWYDGTKVPLQIGIGMNGLLRYHQLTGDERVKQSMLQAADKLSKSVFPEGNFIYIDAPGYRWNYYASVVLESLGYLWGITGNEAYFKIAERSFVKCLNEKTMNGTAIAYNWRYTLRYMYWADKAGILKDLHMV